MRAMVSLVGTTLNDLWVFTWEEANLVFRLSGLSLPSELSLRAYIPSWNGPPTPGRARCRRFSDRYGWN